MSDALMKFHNLFCSINGFSNIVTIKKITEELVGSFEDFVRMELFDLLQSLCIQQNFEFDDYVKKSFFGTHYANAPDFRFTKEEKRLILDLGHRVDLQPNTNEISAALEQLSLDDNPEKVGFSGWYFRNIEEESSHISSQSQEDSDGNTHTHIILKKLLRNADRNCHRPPAGYRFDHDVKDWAAFIRMLAGPLGYAAIQENRCLALPSLSSINHFIQNTKVITEGVLRPYELELYLRQRNLPLIVSISEDATRIQGRVQYDSRSNQVVGFVLPIDPTNGLPTPFVFKARNTEEIVDHFVSGTPTAGFVNTIMV